MIIKNRYIQAYLKTKPAFFALIRPQELAHFAECFADKNLKDKKILDIGCGDGFFTSILVEDFLQKPQLTGVDISASVLEQAKKWQFYQDLQEFNGVKLPFPDNNFDYIFSNCVLEHVARLPENLVETARVLKPGGFYYTSVMTDQWSEFLLGRKLFGKRYSDWLNKKQVHRNLLSQAAWQKQFTDAGFKVVGQYGYFDKQLARESEILHYLSVPTLISYKLFKKYILFPGFFDIVRIDKVIQKLLNRKFKSENSAAIFFILQKENY
ncbi:MAG: class I SAM-dependent methyltransferase [bacterium]